MPIIITELAVQADGTFAIELHNNGSMGMDLTAYFLGGGIRGSFSPAQLVPGPFIAPGSFFTIGHSSIPGLDFSSAPTDGFFDAAPMDAVALLDPAFVIVDHMGQDNGLPISRDNLSK